MAAAVTSAIASSITSAASLGRTSTLLPTIKITAGQAITTTLSIPYATPSAKAASQSILDAGASAPNVYSASDPLVLFIIQVSIIVALSRLIGVVLARLRQPKVVGEVIAGLVLGPSMMGRIPGFTQAIFPTASIPMLTLVANLGLCFFLFLVGLEADFSVFKRNAKSALAISAVGLAVPFALGCAVSVGLYHKFIDTATVDFGIFLLFIGTAMSITAFPVLARILTELKMLQNPVGLAVLAAGVGNDVVGWILLALSVALANAGSGVTAVYILLCGAGLCLVLAFIVRPIFVYFVRKTGAYENGPGPGIMTLIFFIILAASFVTDVIGIHPIFGAFLVGLIVVPHHHGLAAGITEKLEDIVTILFIPIYFTLSGLKTNLGLLNSGSIWGWVVCVVAVAFFSKFISCFGVAKACGYPMRESLAVGSLMSCKGLVELIVLNVGLNAGILNNEVFAIFVFMALFTTFLTTPLTLAFYPEKYWKGKSLSESEGGAQLEKREGADGERYFRKNFVIVLEKLESLPSMMSFVRLLQPSGEVAKPKSTASASIDSVDRKDGEGEEGITGAKLDRVPTSEASTADGPTHSTSNISVNAYRLLALSERTSAVIKAAEVEMTKRDDSILNIFTAFANLASIPLTTSMSIVPTESFAETVTSHAADRNADMLVIPWAAGTSLDPEADGPSGNPLEGLFGNQVIERSPQYASFVRSIFVESQSDVAVFLDGGVNAPSARATIGGHQHIFLPFIGGPDDRAALDFVMQLVDANSQISATVARIVKGAEDTEDDSKSNTDTAGQAEGSTSPLAHLHQLTVGANVGHHDTVYAGHGTQHRLASDTADNIALARYFPSAIVDSPSSEAASPPMLEGAVARTTFRTLRTSTPLKSTLSLIQEVKAAQTGSVLVVVGRSRRSAPTHRVELERYLKEKVVAGHGIQSLGIAASSDVRKTLGDIGSAVVVSGEASSVLILQSAVKGEAYLKGKKGKGV